MRMDPKFLLIALVSLAGCQVYQPTATPDYTIRVLPTAKGMVAVPPTCPNWATDVTDPYDNQPVPQFGCANARNLAMMADRPDDLVVGRDLGETRGVPLVGSIRRYDNNQTRGLIFTSSSIDSAVDITTAPSPASVLTGDATTLTATGGSPSAGASSSSSSSSTAP